MATLADTAQPVGPGPATAPLVWFLPLWCVVCTCLVACRKALRNVFWSRFGCVRVVHVQSIGRWSMLERAAAAGVVVVVWLLVGCLRAVSLLWWGHCQVSALVMCDT